MSAALLAPAALAASSGQHHCSCRRSSSRQHLAAAAAPRPAPAAAQRCSSSHAGAPGLHMLQPSAAAVAAAHRAASSIRCRAAPAGVKSSLASTGDATGAEVKEAHKIFDEAVITIKSGAGGAGEIVEAGRGKFVKNLKYHAGGNQPKQIWLPASAPADGADGADVYIVADPALDSLLHLHARKVWSARKGAHGNPAAGSAGPKRNSDSKKARTPALEVPVPPGTVIKRKSSGQVLGEVLQPGDRVLVAKGGKGGSGLVAPSRLQKQRDLSKEFKQAQKAGAEVYAVEDINWKADSKGLPGQQMSLQLLLRVVADVGLVGFPNAGKSSLLGALTRASPEVAPYPFTTLMPNLGVLAAGGQAPVLAAGGQAPVLADLPGLIEGAHLGKGLGRMFLRHLRRTRLLLHVVDAATADPATDYLAVRQELRMYNPTYVTRPHVVALNKIDLEDAGGLQQEIADEVMAVARDLQQQHEQDVPGLTLPAAIVPCSAVTGEGLQQLAAALQAVLEQPDYSEQRPSIPRQQLQQQAGAAAGVTAAVAAALGVDRRPHAAGSSTSSSGAGAGAEGWEEEEEDDARLASLSSISLSTSREDADAWPEDEEENDDDEPPPPPLSPDDPDAHLLHLSEDELLRRADESESDGW